MIVLFMIAPWNFAIKLGSGVRKLENLLRWPVVFAGLAACAPGESNRTEVVVFAAASLTEVVGDIAQIVETANPDVRVRTNFAGSQQLAQQIAHGAQADVFATADERWMDFLIEGGFARGKTQFATNRLVVITRTGLTFRDIAKPGMSIIVGAEVVPVGHYTRRVFSRIEAASDYGPDFARAISRNVVSEEDNVRAILAKVLLGEADAGFVYDTDVQGLHNQAYHVVSIPVQVNLSAQYFIARTADANDVGAEAFMQVLTARAGQSVLRTRGFSPI